MELNSKANLVSDVVIQLLTQLITIEQISYQFNDYKTIVKFKKKLRKYG